MTTQRMERAPAPDAASEVIEALRAEVARLAERVAALEAAVRGPAPSTGAHPAAGAPAPAPAPPPAEEVTEELLTVIGAAVAAFLGKRARIRQIRLTDSRTWAHQGRVSIQASHTLAR